MKLHANAALSLNQRRRLVGRVVEEGWSLTKAAEAAEVSDRTAAKWVGRFRADGETGLLDRSSAPAVVANRTDERRVEAIAALRRLRFTGPEIAELLGMALSTVSGILAIARGYGQPGQRSGTHCPLLAGPQATGRTRAATPPMRPIASASMG